jgi:hypothetical protein
MDVLIDRTKIGVVGLGTGAGTGFVSTCLGRAMADGGDFHPAVIELGRGGLYDSLGMDKRFAGKQFFPFCKAVSQEQSIRGKSNGQDGVNWMLLPPGESCSSLDLYRKLRLINNALGDMVICRLAGLEGEHLWRLLWEMDRVLVVIDPLPSSLMAAHDFLCELRVSGLPLTYIINKYNGGVNRRELMDFLKIKQISFLPMVEPEEVYRAEYTCHTVYDMPLAKGKLKRPLDNLINDILL